MRTTVALDDDLVRILCSGSKEMRNHLNEGQIVIHPSIIAELALALPEERSLQVAQSEMVQRETVKPTPAFVPGCGSPRAPHSRHLLSESLIGVIRNLNWTPFDACLYCLRIT